MATLTHVPQVPIGLVHMVIGTIATADTWRGEPVSDIFQRLVENTSEEDLPDLPVALGEALLPLRGSRDAQDLALDVIRSFDLYEAWPGLAALLRQTPTDLAVMVGAALARHPGVPAGLGDVTHLAAQLVDDDAGVARRARSLITGTLPSGATELDHWAWAERWPGRVAVADAPGPLVVLRDGAGAKDDEFQLLIKLQRAGAHTRRIPAESQSPPEGWVPPWAVLVTAVDAPPWYPTKWPVIKTAGSLGVSRQRTIMKQLVKRFKGSLALRWDGRGSRALVHKELPDPLSTVDVFFEGALLSPETAYLTGWSTRVIKHRVHDDQVLRPRYLKQIPYFDFGQLTAMRIEAFVSQASGRKYSRGLAAKVVRLSKQEERVPTYITQEGKVLFMEDGVLTEPSGQTTAEEFHIDQIVERFYLGGRTVPSLFDPSEYTRVHPLVQRGVPTIAGTRIAATAVRDLMERGRTGGLDDSTLRDWVRGYYDLSDEQLIDGERVGLEIAA